MAGKMKKALDLEIGLNPIRDNNSLLKQQVIFVSLLP